MGQFRKKPVIIEAMQFDGSNEDAIIKAFFPDADRKGKPFSWNHLTDKLVVWTAEGPLTASKGDWIIRGVKGEFYPCKPDIFEQTYEPCEAQS